MGCTATKPEAAKAAPSAAAGGSTLAKAQEAVNEAATKAEHSSVGKTVADGVNQVAQAVTETVHKAHVALNESVVTPLLEKKQGTLNLGGVIPNFECNSTIGRIQLHDYFGSSWGVLFSHPADFTPVCTTELNLVNVYLPKFTALNCKVIALSCDPVDSHKAWSKDVLAFNDQTASQSELSYPIIADESREIAVTLGMLDPVSKDAAGLPNTCRAVFVVGPEKTLKLSILYPATTGRNFDEIIRVIESLQLTAQRKLATPADWESGDDCIVSTAVSQEDAPKLFPKGVRIVDLPSKKPYLRFTPDPRKDETAPPPVTAPAATPAALPTQSGLNLGDELPNFECDTTQGKIRLHDFLGSSWGVLFSHPADYTPVCSTELGAVAKLDEEFRARDVKVIAMSCDPVESHMGWSQDVLAYCQMDKSQLPFPIIADPSREIATKLGMLDPVSKDAAGLPNTCRAVFVIGPDKKLKLSLLYPATTGRKFSEIFRAIDSLQLTAHRKLATPGNWVSGKDCIVSTAVSQEDAPKMFPLGVRIVDLPSKKPYLRFTPCPPVVPKKSPVPSADEWSKSDEQLANDAAFKELHARYSKPCSDETLAATVKALEQGGHVVKVCETKAQALEYLASLIKDKMSVSNGYSTTLEQIGYIDYLKSQDDRIINYKGRAAAAAASGDQAEHSRLITLGASADIFVSSVGAVAETGEVIAGDLTGTRCNGWIPAQRVVLVAGTNKIVADLAEAKERLYKYQLPLESARVRVAYKVPASAVNNEITLTRSHPMNPRSTIVLIKEPLGF